jgi:hypothetical protein
MQCFQWKHNKLYSYISLKTDSSGGDHYIDLGTPDEDPPSWEERVYIPGRNRPPLTENGLTNAYPEAFVVNNRVRYSLVRDKNNKSSGILFRLNLAPDSITSQSNGWLLHNLRPDRFLTAGAGLLRVSGQDQPLVWSDSLFRLFAGDTIVFSPAGTDTAYILKASYDRPLKLDVQRVADVNHTVASLLKQAVNDPDQD